MTASVIRRVNRSLDRAIKHTFGDFQCRNLVAWAVACVLILGCVATAALLLSSARQLLDRLLEQTADNSAREVSGILDGLLEAPEFTARSIELAVEDGRIITWDDNSRLQFLWDLPERLRYSHMSKLYLATADGRMTGLEAFHDPQDTDRLTWEVLLSNPNTLNRLATYEPRSDGTADYRIKLGEPFDPRTRPWYTRAVEAGEPAWTDIYWDIQTGKATVTRAHPIYRTDGSLVGVAGVDLFIADLQNQLRHLPLTARSEVFISDRNGLILASHSPTPAINGEPNAMQLGESPYPFTQALGPLMEADQRLSIARDEPFNERITLGRESGFLLLSTIAREHRLGWTLGVFVPQSDYLGSIWSVFARVLPWLALSLGVMLLAMTGFLSLVVRPLHQLRSAANRIATGEFNVSLETSCDNEVGELSRAIDRMRAALKRAFLDLDRERLIAQTTLASIADGVITLDERGHILYMNEAASRLTGQAPGTDAAGQNLQAVFRATDSLTAEPVGLAQILQRLEHDPDTHHALHLAGKDDNRQPIECRISRLHQPAPGPQGRHLAEQATPVPGMALFFSDLSERWRLESRLVHLTSHDSLTGLLNRRAFEQQLDAALQSARHGKAEAALLFINLDQFQLINATSGHAVGDELLKQVARMLDRTQRSSDAVARLGADEFGVLLLQTDASQALDRALELRTSVNGVRFNWQERTWPVSCRLGVKIISAELSGVDAALRDASSACLLAKASNEDRVQLFEAGEEQIHRQRAEVHWVQRLRMALEHDRFALYMQTIEPTVQGDSDPLHVEILLRLHDEDGLVVAPGQFLPAAERYGLAPSIDRWVVSHTLAWLAANPACAERLSLCAINLSGASISDANFPAFLQAELDASAVEPEKLCFEITETAAIAHLPSAITMMNGLRTRGCRFALDDFGSGLSSFAYLKHLPVDFLKIDGLFVKDMLSDDVDRAMVNSINDVGHTLGMQTVAEFVENDSIRQQLRGICVDFVQGYGVAHPRPLAELVETEGLSEVG